MDIFSEDAFESRREYICGFYRGEHGELYRDYPYLSPEQADGFVTIRFCRGEGRLWR